MNAQNGNIPNCAAASNKRRKGVKQKHASKPKLPPDAKMLSFHHSINSFSNSNIPSDHTSYNYFPVNYQQQLAAEPASLPIYPFMYHGNPYNSPTVLNGYGVSSKTSGGPFSSNNFLANDNSATEYTSLPVGPHDPNNATGGDSLDKRRFSDPGFPLDDDDSDDSGASNMVDERLVHRLSRQIDLLKEANRRLNRDVMDLRMELNVLKQQQSLRHYERDYEPGMLSEVIKEIRDAARVREDALLAKVKHMIEEKQFSMSQINMANSKSLYAERVTKLEEQMKNIHLNISSNRNRVLESTAIGNSVMTPSSSGIDDHESIGGTQQNLSRQVIELEREALLLRKELQEARARKDESDQQLIQLDKKLNNLMTRSANNRDVATAALPRGSDASEDGKTTALSADSLSMSTLSSGGGGGGGGGSYLPSSSHHSVSSTSNAAVAQRVITLTGPDVDPDDVLWKVDENLHKFTFFCISKRYL